MTGTGHKEVRLPEELVGVIASLELNQMLQLQQHFDDAIALAEKYSRLRELLVAEKWEEAD